MVFQRLTAGFLHRYRAWCCCLCLLLAAFALAKGARSERVITHIGWTSDTLYLTYQVDDPMVVGNQTQPLGQPWQDDAVAVYLNLDPATPALNSHCVRVVISAAGGATVQRIAEGEWKDAPEWFQASQYGTIRYAVSVQGTLNELKKPSRGYTVEVGLAWGLLGVHPPFVQHEGDPLPEFGLALACYSRGEAQGVSCWPPALTEDGLNTPAHWGHVRFAQAMQVQTCTDTLLEASLLPGVPTIDGKLESYDWLTAGVVTFPIHKSAVTPMLPFVQPSVGLIATWYLLDTPEMTAIDQPLEPTGLWTGPDSPLYHALQIRDARHAGIDALVVSLPLDPARRGQTRARLAALAGALADYELTSSVGAIAAAPLLMPALDGRGLETLDLRSEAAHRQVESLLDDFYALVPPQFRVMLPDAGGQYHLPVMLANPPAHLTNDVTWLIACAGRLQAHLGRPIGWMPDAQWTQPAEMLPGALARCAWGDIRGVQLSDGAIAAAVIAPSAPGTSAEIVTRRGTEIFTNGWTKITASHAEMVLLNSWNDFAHGTEIAPSRQYGYDFSDGTRAALVKLGTGKKFNLRIVQHNLPSVMRPGETYQIELVVKNGAMTQLIGREGDWVQYHIFQHGRKVASGLATRQLVILAQAMARVRFALPIQADRSHPLAPGPYELRLEFRHNKIADVAAPLLTEMLGTLSLPMTVGDTALAAQVDKLAVPNCLLARQSAQAQIEVRNLSDTVWKPYWVVMRLTWQSEDGVRLAGQGVGLTTEVETPTGGAALYHGALPPAPAQPGWYHLNAELIGATSHMVALGSLAIVQVVAADVRAQFMDIQLPKTFAGDDPVVVPIAVKNTGATPWTKQATQVTYQWLALDGQPIPGATGSAPIAEDVRSWRVTTLRLPVAPPPGAGAFRCAFGLTHAGQSALLMTDMPRMWSPIAAVTVRAGRYTPVDLQAALNDWAASSDTTGVPSRANFDGNGNAFPAEEFLPDAANPTTGYPCGYYLAAPDAAAPVFHFAPMQHGRAAMVRAKGQSVALPAQAASVLHLVAASAGKIRPTVFTVHYADGTEEDTELYISNWLDDPAHHEPLVLKTRHLHTPTGDNAYLQGSLFAYRIPVDPKKTLKSLELPDNTDIGLFAVTMETKGR